jgi:MFS family permease
MTPDPPQHRLASKNSKAAAANSGVSPSWSVHVGRRRMFAMAYGTATGFGRNFWGLTASNGLFFAGFHMLLPTVPLLATEMGGSSTEVGLIAGIFVFSSVITRLFANALIQALGFRACLLAGIAISFVSVLLYPLAGSVETLLWIRLVHGAGFGIGTTFYVSLVMEFIPAGRRGEGLGYFGLATTVAMAVAPASGLWIIEAFGFTPMFLLSATCEILSFLALSMCSMPASLDRPAVDTEKADAAAEAASRTTTSWTATFVEKGTSRAALMTVLFGAAYGSVLNFVAVYAQEMQSSFAGMFFVIATTCIFVARLGTAKAYDLKGPAWVIAPGAVVMGTGLTVLALGSSTAMFLSAAALYGAGVGMLFPALQAETLSPVAPHRRSAASATFSNALDTGLGGGSVVLGLFAESAGLSAAYLVATGCCVAVLAALFAGGREVRELVPSVEEQ